MARAIRVPYLVSATSEYGCANLGRGSASLALRLARKFLRDGAIDVKVCTPRGRVLQSDELDHLKPTKETDAMAKGQQRSNREAKKPKKEKPKIIAAAPSTKNSGVGDQVARSGNFQKK